MEKQKCRKYSESGNVGILPVGFLWDTSDT